MKNLWEIKQISFDAIVKIHKGKFYEMFNLDTIFAWDVLKLRLAVRNEKSICGIPDKTFSEWKLKIINSGKHLYKIKQVETAIDQRSKKSGEKVVKHVHQLKFVLLTVQLCHSIMILSTRAILQICWLGLSL
jgi:DNA mismatch repair ATPase MutS